MYAGLMAFAYARSEVNPDGSVANVEVEVYPSRPLDNHPFEAEVKRSLSLWKYEPAPEGMTGKRVACKDVFFELK
jgi:hypothetical protein